MIFKRVVPQGPADQIFAMGDSFAPESPGPSLRYSSGFPHFSPAALLKSRWLISPSSSEPASLNLYAGGNDVAVGLSLQRAARQFQQTFLQRMLGAGVSRLLLCVN
jgi:hypothetical protein